MDAVQLKSSDT